MNQATLHLTPQGPALELGGLQMPVHATVGWITKNPVAAADLVRRTMPSVKTRVEEARALALLDVLTEQGNTRDRVATLTRAFPKIRQVDIATLTKVSRQRVHELVS